MFAFVNFSRFGIPLGKVDALMPDNPGPVRVQSVKIMGVIEEPYTCEKCGRKDLKAGCIVYFKGVKIGGPGVKFDIEFSFYCCPACAGQIAQTMGSF